MEIIAEKTEKTQPEQLALFEPSRWPRRPYCTDDLRAGLKIRPLVQALECRYIQPNPPVLRAWIILDVDRRGAAFAWEDRLPPPTWAAVSRRSGHAHLVWALETPVLVEGLEARDAPMRYLAAVEGAMRDALRADPGYAGLIAKNPLHPYWKTMWLARRGYSLADLATWLEEGCGIDIRRYRPRTGRDAEQVGLGRNVSLFDRLRHYAYRQIRYYKTDVRNFLLWQSHLNTKALELNTAFAAPLDPREVWYIVKSVAKWTWRQFDVGASDERFSRVQAHRGRMSGLSRAAKAKDKRASARLMAAQGMTQRGIAAELGVSVGTVNAWLK